MLEPDTGHSGAFLGLPFPLPSMPVFPGALQEIMVRSYHKVLTNPLASLVLNIPIQHLISLGNGC